MTKFNFSKALILLIFIFSLNGCLNVDQKTKINKDLSGTINLHYWSPTVFVDIGDVTMGDEIGGFSYVDSEIKRKYNSESMEMVDVRRYIIESDSTSHVVVNMKFTDFNKLSDAPGFYNITASYVKGKDGFDFKYLIPRDTTIRTNYVKEKNTLEYTFEFPDEVLETNGTKEGNVVKWKFQVADLVNQDFELTATVKEKFSVCGLFGIELPVILLFGLAIFVTNIKKRRK